MKSTLLSTLLLLSTQLFAANGAMIQPAIDTAAVEASVEIHLDEIEAFEATVEIDEVVVKFLAHDHAQNVDTILTYGCHLHGSHIACHEEDHLIKSKQTKPELMIAHDTAMKKLAKSLKRQATDLSVVKYVKAWKAADDHGHDHDHGTDMWTKVIYEVENIEKTVFVQCHQHPGQTKYACHYKKTGPVAPNFENGENHDEGEHDH